MSQFTEKKEIIVVVLQAITLYNSGINIIRKDGKNEDGL